MKHKVYIMDTNLLLCLVDSKNHGTVGSGEKWTKESLLELLEGVDSLGETVAIPLPMIIEGSNLIGHDKEIVAGENLIEILNKTFNGNRPFREFKEQSLFWEDERIKEALNHWKDYIYNELGLGDFLVLLLKDYYEDVKNFTVEIITGDNALKSLEKTKLFKFRTKGSNRIVR